MSDAPRCSLDSRYEREGSGHDGHDAHPHAPVPATTPVPYVSPQAVAVAVPAPTTQVFTTPVSSVVGTGANVFTGVATAPTVVAPPVIVAPPPMVMPQPVFGMPSGPITVINNPPPAGSPCPVCGKPLGEAASHKPHEHEHKGPPSAPRFSKATPEVFRDGFKPLWDSAQADQAAYVVVSGCNKLLTVLLVELEAKAKHDKTEDDKPRAKSSWWAPKKEEKKPTLADRIETLQKRGYLLKSTANAAKESGMSEVLTEKIDASAVTGEMARRYVQLLWQVADQGFEQPGWSQSGEFPKAVPGPVDPHAHHPAPQAAHAGGGHLPAPAGDHH